MKKLLRNALITREELLCCLMNREVFFFLFALLLLFPIVDVGFRQVSATSGNSVITLADVIHQGIDSINWSDTSLTHFGIIFGRQNLSDYDVEIQNLAANQDWVSVICLLRLAEIDGYTSAILQSVGEQALANHSMAGSLPANYDGYNGLDYLVYHRNELHGYDYATKWNCETSKWDAQKAFDDFCRLYDNTSSFVYFGNPDTNFVVEDNRHYDAAAETLGVFLVFEELGVLGATERADQVWQRINSYNWSGYYPYRLGADPIVECEIAFSTIIGQYLQMRGGSIPYADRIFDDINYKLLANGWNSPDWSPGGYVIRHAIWNPEERLGNTLNAIQVLQSYYPQFNGSMQNSFVQLLTGFVPAWLGLTQTDLCDPTQGYRFRGSTALVAEIDPNTGRMKVRIPSLDDRDTAIGDLLLFLEGVVPGTGSLAIPKLDECYEDVCSSFSVKNFGFNYNSRTIRIPVNAGELKFQFGTTLVSYDFPANGTYEIRFSSDWNSIIGIRKIAQNGKIIIEASILDVIAFVNAYGSEPNDSNWNVCADLNMDNKVDILDAIVLGNQN